MKQPYYIFQQGTWYPIRIACTRQSLSAFAHFLVELLEKFLLAVGKIHRIASITMLGQSFCFITWKIVQKRVILLVLLTCRAKCTISDSRLARFLVHVEHLSRE